MTAEIHDAFTDPLRGTTADVVIGDTLLRVSFAVQLDHLADYRDHYREDLVLVLHDAHKVDRHGRLRAPVHLGGQARATIEAALREELRL